MPKFAWYFWLLQHTEVMILKLNLKLMHAVFFACLFQVDFAYFICSLSLQFFEPTYIISLGHCFPFYPPQH